MSDAASILARNLAEIRQRMAGAAIQAGRPPAEVRLVAVTKYASLHATRLLMEAGCTDLGESRPQDLWRKAADLAAPQVCWHMIGHWQRNKVRRALPHVGLLHSLDSLRLAQTVQEEAVALGRMAPALVEVNVSGDADKHGFQPGAVEAALTALAAHDRLQIKGLMAMAALDSGPDRVRRDFARLRELRDQLRGVAPAQIDLQELSMGMSGDFEAAIAEGATLVRIGSALFEGLPSP